MSAVTRFILLKSTTANRLAYTPKAGELLYDIDLAQLYVGDNVTVGGNAVGAMVNNEDIQDIVGNLIGDSTTIDVTYDDSGNVLTMDVIPAALNTSDFNNDANFQNLTQVQSLVDAHANLINNPHSVTAAQVGLGNVDNTSDLNKPISTATQNALDLKYDLSNPNGYETPTQLNSRDAANRNRSNHTGTQLANTISNFATAVLSTILTGLSTATSTAVVATDTILIAIGKLQAQINSLTPPIFGTEFEEGEDLDNVTFTANTIFEAYTFPTASKPPGKYRVAINVQYEPAATNANDLFQIRINGTQIGLEYEYEGKDTQADIRNIVALRGYYQHNITGSFNVELWAGQDGGGTTVIHGCDYEVWRVS